MNIFVVSTLVELKLLMMTLFGQSTRFKPIFHSKNHTSIFTRVCPRHIYYTNEIRRQGKVYRFLCFTFISKEMNLSRASVYEVTVCFNKQTMLWQLYATQALLFLGPMAWRDSL